MGAISPWAPRKRFRGAAGVWRAAMRAFMSCRGAHKRAMPGRIVGSRSTARPPAYRLSLQMRELHIRGEKARERLHPQAGRFWPRPPPSPPRHGELLAVFHGPRNLKGHKRRTCISKAVRLAEEPARGAIAPGPERFSDTITCMSADRKAGHGRRRWRAGSTCATWGRPDRHRSTRHAEEHLLASPAPSSATRRRDRGTGHPRGAVAHERPYLTHPIFHDEPGPRAR